MKKGIEVYKINRELVSDSGVCGFVMINLFTQAVMFQGDRMDTLIYCNKLSLIPQPFPKRIVKNKPGQEY
jgi:hypothetical protein